MELRHLRYFIAVAEELHFGRAADRLCIEQSPLSRSIKDLEKELGALLFERTSRNTRLTWPGQVLLKDARRIFTALEQARTSVQAAASGYRGTLRIALSDVIAKSRLSVLLALCREEEPEVEIRLFEVPVAQQMKGLRDDTYDAGITFAFDASTGILAQPVWHDPLVVALPVRHPLLVHKRVPLIDVMNHPLILCHPEACEGWSKQLDLLLHPIGVQPVVAERVSTHDLMLALVAAGYGVGFSSVAHLVNCHHADVVVRPVAGHSIALTTYLLRPDNPPSEQLGRFIDRVGRVAALATAAHH